MNIVPADSGEHVLKELFDRGIEAWRVGDRIRYRPRDAMTEDLAAQIASVRGQLLMLLPVAPPVTDWSACLLRLIRQCPCDDLRSDLRDMFEETAATLEFEQGLARADAEMQAFGQVLFRLLQLGVDARVAQ